LSKKNKIFITYEDGCPVFRIHHPTRGRTAKAGASRTSKANLPKDSWEKRFCTHII
jgi:hypothetical protein